MFKRSASKREHLPVRRIAQGGLTSHQGKEIIESPGPGPQPQTPITSEHTGRDEPPAQHVHIHYHAASSYSIESTRTTRTTIYHGSQTSVLSGHAAPAGRGGRVGGLLLALALWAIVLGIVAAIATAILAARGLGS